MLPATGQAEVSDVDRLTLILRDAHEAIGEEPRREGRQPKLARARAAVEWLRREGIDKVTAHADDRCGKALTSFLADWDRCAEYDISENTVESLAGVLIGYLKAATWHSDVRKVHPSKPAPPKEWRDDDAV
jgi:hypothetical protein